MTREITGEDVIGLPGQNLTSKELRVLVGLADGETPTKIAQVVQADRTELRHIEGNIQRKLGAKTKTHMVARGFILGVLMPRALCLLLAFMAVIGSYDEEMNRVRRPNRGRTNTNIVRLVKSTRSGGTGGRGYS